MFSPCQIALLRTAGIVAAVISSALSSAFGDDAQTPDPALQECEKLLAPWYDVLFKGQYQIRKDTDPEQFWKKVTISTQAAFYRTFAAGDIEKKMHCFVHQLGEHGALADCQWFLSCPMFTQIHYTNYVGDDQFGKWDYPRVFTAYMREFAKRFVTDPGFRKRYWHFASWYQSGTGYRIGLRLYYQCVQVHQHLSKSLGKAGGEKWFWIQRFVVYAYAAGNTDVFEELDLDDDKAVREAEETFFKWLNTNADLLVQEKGGYRYAMPKGQLPRLFSLRAQTLSGTLTSPKSPFDDWPDVVPAPQLGGLFRDFNQKFFPHPSDYPPLVATKPAPVPDLQLPEPASKSKKDALDAIRALEGEVSIDGSGHVISVDLSYMSKIHDRDLLHLQHFPKLQTLELVGTNISNTGLSYLKPLKNLQALELSGTQIDDEGLNHLQGMQNLQLLRFANTGVTDSGLVDLKGLHNLETLCVNRQITDVGLVQLKGLSRLRSLNLAQTRITDDGLKELSALIELRSLELSFTGISDEGLKQLRLNRNLEELQLTHTRVSDDGLASLNPLIHLRELGLAETQITGSGLSHLDGLSSLQTLNLYGTRVADAELGRLQHFPNLQTLQLGHTAVSDEGLKQLKSISRLQTLMLARTFVTDDGLRHLKGLTKLAYLNLDYDDITGAGLQHLIPLKRLTTLSLRWTKVSDVGVKHLKEMSSLQNLYLIDTKMSEGGIKTLEAALPDCDIAH